MNLNVGDKVAIVYWEFDWVFLPEQHTKTGVITKKYKSFFRQIYIVKVSYPSGNYFYKKVRKRNIVEVMKKDKDKSSINLIK